MKILKFYGTWCAPCKALTNTIADLGFSDKVTNIDVDEDPTMASSHGVRGLPTMVKLDENGNEIARLVGSQSKETIEKFFA